MSKQPAEQAVHAGATKLLSVTNGEEARVNSNLKRSVCNVEIKDIYDHK